MPPSPGVDCYEGAKSTTNPLVSPDSAYSTSKNESEVVEDRHISDGVDNPPMQSFQLVEGELKARTGSLIQQWQRKAHMEKADFLLSESRHTILEPHHITQTRYSLSKTVAYMSAPDTLPMRAWNPGSEDYNAVSSAIDRQELQFYSSDKSIFSGSASLLRALRSPTYMADRLKCGVTIDKIVCFSQGNMDLRLPLLQLAQSMAKVFVDMQGGQVPCVDIYAERLDVADDDPVWKTIPWIPSTDILSREMDKYRFHLVNYGRGSHEGVLGIDENTLVLDGSRNLGVMTLLREMGLVPGAILKMMMHHPQRNFQWDAAPSSTDTDPILNTNPDPIAWEWCNVHPRAW
ncbi:hypothetical protein B0T16DRAFT_456721 [Cercophora newfieldiana]|uniref:Uncharacterized protein n=1 Tax=Cercophora newfieldiana TaxID=92897 RepID=A0AA40CS86_9PEZI|nr:hypothetical protein B0T16DRAFT_456721 [Cercophora newfieldiana]